MHARLGTALVASVLSSTLMAGIPEELRICWMDGLQEPFLMLDKNNQATGIAVEMVTEILRRKNIKFTNTLLPWKRCLLEIEKGGMDILPIASYNEERAKFAYFTEPLYVNHLVFFYQTDKFNKPPNIKDIEGMKPYRFGGVLGFNNDQYDGKITIDTGAYDRKTLIKN
ncbi:substrate-binding periplasmic protein [Chitinimonas sp. PSY-7]|uniref:transporter substrate-binding domain-containing protein n=1 Tax=Chitinimonas sp. PSY-7 TaxID=3459088 RepID=UPI00403FD646